MITSEFVVAQVISITLPHPSPPDEWSITLESLKRVWSENCNRSNAQFGNKNQIFSRCEKEVKQSILDGIIAIIDGLLLICWLLRDPFFARSLLWAGTLTGANKSRIDRFARLQPIKHLICNYPQCPCRTVCRSTAVVVVGRVANKYSGFICCP